MNFFVNCGLIGFNGMLRDDDVRDKNALVIAEEGRGNSYSTEFRGYDPRRGQWLSPDPLAYKFPWSSSYVGMGNNPVIYIDKDGKEPSKNQATNINDFITALKKANVQNIHDAYRFMGGFLLRVNNASSDKVSRGSVNNEGTKPRYLYTKAGGWIDFRHFFGAAHIESMVGSNSIALYMGEKAEEEQQSKKSLSSFSYEDLPSNYQGILFGDKYGNLQGDKFYFELSNFLNALGATNPTEAPNWNLVPENEETAYNKKYEDVLKNYTYTPMWAPDNNEHILPLTTPTQKNETHQDNTKVIIPYLLPSKKE